MSASPSSISHEELVALHDKFREVKHSINNTLAVIMALSELSERDPKHYEKLAKMVLSRSPDVVSQLQEFSTLLNAKVKGTAPAPSAGTSPPSLSGVF